MKSFFQKVADLERDDPEIRELGRQVRADEERGEDPDARGSANSRFNEAVDRKLGR
jgi:hypothetical protein